MADQPQIRLIQEENFNFKLIADEPGDWSISVDENPPLGTGRGPSPARLLAAAVGHCLAASFVFCMQKWKEPVEGGIEVDVNVTIDRNEDKKLRIDKIDVEIRLPESIRKDDRAYTRCMESFEDYCIVTASVRQGIPVNVQLK